VVVGDIVKGKVPSGYSVSSAGGFEAKSAAESIEEEVVDVANVFGRGKRRKEPNRLYCTNFWRHDMADEDSD